MKNAYLEYAYLVGPGPLQSKSIEGEECTTKGRIGRGKRSANATKICPQQNKAGNH